MILSNQCVIKKKARKKFKGSQNQVKMEAKPTRASGTELRQFTEDHFGYGKLAFKKQQDLKLT